MFLASFYRKWFTMTTGAEASTESEWTAESGRRYPWWQEESEPESQRAGGGAGKSTWQSGHPTDCWWTAVQVIGCWDSLWGADGWEWRHEERAQGYGRRDWGNARQFSVPYLNLHFPFSQKLGALEPVALFRSDIYLSGLS